MNKREGRMSVWAAAASLILAFALVACAPEGGSEADHEHAEGEATHTHEAEGAHGHDDGTYDFGEPGDPAESSRTVEIEAKDTMRFEPDLVEIEAGETVTLRISNTGVITHDILLGSHEEQEQHEGEMLHDPTMTHGPNGVLVPPGETRDLVWKFTEPGEVEYGCHVLGHYPSGMVGTITVK